MLSLSLPEIVPANGAFPGRPRRLRPRVHERPQPLPHRFVAYTQNPACLYEGLGLGVDRLGLCYAVVHVPSYCGKLLCIPSKACSKIAPTPNPRMIAIATQESAVTSAPGRRH